MAQGMQGQPQGQMVSGHYVNPSFFQNLVPLAQIAAGKSLQSDADKMAAALRGKQQQEESAITDAINSGNFNLARNLASNAQYGGGQAYKSALVGNAIPKAPETLSEKDIQDFKLRERELASREKDRAASLALAKVPMGYRPTANGGLEPIPGGPADMAATNKIAGKNQVDELIAGLQDQYRKLSAGGGITSTNQGALGNTQGWLSSSAAGQGIGKMFGTENQSARNSIAQSRPLLLQAIKNATGMSAKQMDSNAELKMYLAAATDPTLDLESNMRALEQLSNLYGGGNPQQLNNGLPSQSAIDAEIARRQKK
jgi:hypothetical protein